MTATMTRPADLWTDAALDEFAFENRMAMEDERDAFEHAKAVREVCEMASDVINALLAESLVTHPLLKDRRRAELDAEVSIYRENLELMTGETWPDRIPEFLGKCDRLVRDHDEAAA